MICRSTLNSLMGLTLWLSLALVGVITPAFGDARVTASFPVNTFMVTNINDSGPGSLREAIADANANPGADLISVSANGTLLLLSPLPVVTDSVTIQGPGSSLFAVDGNNSFRGLDLSAADVILADLTIQHGVVTGSAEYGAGIRSSGTLTLDRVEVIDNTAQSHGAGIFSSGNLTITDGGIRNNTSTNGIGGGLRSLGTTVISGTQILGNASQGDGGGIYALSVLDLTNALFQDNYCTATSCDGGGLFSFSHTSIQDSQFVSNTAQDQAGGVSAPGVLTISGSLFQNNQAVFGTGGGLYAQGMATIQNTQFLDNTARSFGGGVYAFATVDLSDVLFQNNQSTIGTGGGLYAGGGLSLTRTQFIGNSAREGGGLTHALGSASLVNALFAENVATSTLGTAMLLTSLGTVDVLHNTVMGPVSGNGSAIEVAAGSAVITNTIIAGHVIGVSNSGGSVQQDFNLFFGNGSDTQGGVSGGANSFTGDPMFVDPSGNDYHLGAGSAAINTGTDAGVTTDIDGDARPLNLGYEIGFDEKNLPFSAYLPVMRK